MRLPGAMAEAFPDRDRLSPVSGDRIRCRGIDHDSRYLMTTLPVRLIVEPHGPEGGRVYRSGKVARSPRLPRFRSQDERQENEYRAECGTVPVWMCGHDWRGSRTG